MSSLLLLPNQLFNLQYIKDVAPDVKEIILCQDPHFFNTKINEIDINFTKLKCVMHRASMKAYQKYASIDYKVKYVEDDAFNYKSSKMFSPHDHTLEKILGKRTYLPSPYFLLNQDDYEEYINDVKDPFFNKTFYEFFRRKLNILNASDKGFKPEGGKYSFDTENRDKMPPSTKVPDPFLKRGKEEINILKEAISYVNSKFENNPSVIDEPEDFLFPITHDEALEMLRKFIQERLKLFGKYQDAFLELDFTNKGSNIDKIVLLFHSGLSSALNSGLITPLDVIEAVEDAYYEGVAPIASVEGFIRQILGWREYMYFVYEKKGEEIRKMNYLDNKNMLNDRWYNYDYSEDDLLDVTPVDDYIYVGWKTAYLHHIIRLMVIGNFMNLVGIDPNEGYKWFMEFSCDAYDWVMVVNVYSMVFYADGGEVTTKPYISSSNYISKMSNYSRKEPWAEIWDSVYYYFLHTNKDKLDKNPRMRYMYATYNKKSNLDKIIQEGKDYIKNYIK